MSVADVARTEPWTVEDLYSLSDDGMRHELLDGSLLVTPPPGVGHQVVCALLLRTLQQAAPSQWVALPGAGVRIPGGLLVPDLLVIAEAVARKPGLAVEPKDLGLVVEVESPTGRRRDRVWKLQAYADAGIPRYWRVVPDADAGPELVVYELRDHHYQERMIVRAGSARELSAPFPVTVDPASLTL